MTRALALLMLTIFGCTLGRSDLTLYDADGRVTEECHVQCIAIGDARCSARPQPPTANDSQDQSPVTPEASGRPVAYEPGIIFVADDGAAAVPKDTVPPMPTTSENKDLPLSPDTPGCLIRGGKISNAEAGVIAGFWATVAACVYGLCWLPK